MMRFSFVLMLVIYTSVATGIAFAQDEIASVGAIRGTVIDTSREENPIEDARVEIIAASSEGEITTLEVFTNANGEFEKEDIEPGRYFVNTYKDKYGDRIGSRVIVAAGSDNVIQIKLTKKDNIFSFFQKFGSLFWPLAFIFVIAFLVREYKR